MSTSDNDLLDLNSREVTAYTDYTQYMRAAKKSKMETDIHEMATELFIQNVDDILFSELAKMKSVIDRVHSFEDNGRQLVEAFQKRAEEYENRLKAENEKLNKICEEFQNFKISHNETCGAALRAFDLEKQKFRAELVDLRRKEEDVLASLADHIKEVSSRVEMRIRVHRDLQDRIAVEGRTRRTSTTATTVVPPATASVASPTPQP